MIDAARRFASTLEQAPYAGRLGFRTGEVTVDAVTASVPYLPLLANAQGFVHGGVAASLATWSALVAAIASDRGHAASAAPVSIALTYLAAAREEELHSTARVSSRGRDIVHVQVEVASGRGRPVAAALAVLRTLADEPAVAIRAGTTAPAAPERGLVSPFSQALGIDLRAHDSSSAALAMRRDGNEGLAGAHDPGALLALADTCAALACLSTLDERLSGSATLSLSAVFGAPLRRAALATGRRVAEDRGVRSALVEVGADAAAASARPALTACVSYRFVAADGLP